MQNIELNNGNLVTIGSLDDALNIIAENLSHDLQNYVYEHLLENHYGYKEVVEELENTQSDYDELLHEYNKITDENYKQRNEIMKLKREIERLKNNMYVQIDDNTYVPVDELPFC